MTGTIFSALRTNLLTNVKDGNGKPIFKTVELWNEQPMHELQEDNDEKPRLLPACYIEFTEIIADGQLTQKVLQKNFNTVLHIVYASLKDNDVAFLDTKQDCYKYTQWFEAGGCNKFKWQTEILTTDFSNLRWFQQIYSSTLKDYSAKDIPNMGTVGHMTTTPIIVPNI